MWNNLSDLLLLLALGAWLTLWLLRDLAALSVRRGTALPRPPARAGRLDRRERVATPRRSRRHRIPPQAATDIGAMSGAPENVPDTLPDSVPTTLLDRLPAPDRTATRGVPPENGTPSTPTPPSAP